MIVFFVPVEQFIHCILCVSGSHAWCQCLCSQSCTSDLAVSSQWKGKILRYMWCRIL